MHSPSHQARTPGVSEKKGNLTIAHHIAKGYIFYDFIYLLEKRRFWHELIVLEGLLPAFQFPRKFLLGLRLVHILHG